LEQIPIGAHRFRLYSGEVGLPRLAKVAP
jgi:hypothetical protein